MAIASVPNFLAESEALTPTQDGVTSFAVNDMDTTGPGGVGFLDLDDAAIFHIVLQLPGNFTSPKGTINGFHHGGAFVPPPLNVEYPNIYVLGATFVIPEPTATIVAAPGVLLFRPLRKNKWNSKGQCGPGKSKG